MISPRLIGPELSSNSSGSYTYDANGNTLSDAQGRSYTWDFENRLTQAVVSGTNGGTTTFKYDPFGRRIYKQSPNATSIFVYDRANLIETVNGSGSEVASYAQTRKIDEPLAELRGSTTDYYEADALGSITSLSSSAGALANTYTYDSFGNLTASTGTVRNYFQYTGREFDPETNLYFYRARYFDPSSGRFISEDPLGFYGSHFDFYTYVRNNPATLNDPFGLCPPQCFAQLKYRPVDDPTAKMFRATHSFWYVQGTSGTQYIISGGPWPPTGNNQNLNVWVNPNINNGVDNVSSTTWWDSGLSSDNCNGVDDLIDEAEGWPDDTIPYSPAFGPNSNSAAHELGSAGGFSPSSPPGSFGWNTPVQ